MPELYHEFTTEKSFKVLKQLKNEFDFILIGGWAIFIYTEAPKSKDVDIIVDFEELKKIRDQYGISKNQRLKKYEIKVNDIDIDIYTPYFSELGFPTEEVEEYTQMRRGFVVPVPEILLILKVVTYEQRRGSSKGEKDLIDIFSLLTKAELDWRKYHRLVEEYDLEEINDSLRDLVGSPEPISELGLSEHRIAKLKEEILEKL
ncbi:hypothetical protein AKJ56_02345 [candidate division MSBL1 archaeon SCGC-AAA382N08]|uniref:Uncharacterized protein n=1 Tax=candidate division MSBL1 archaeon SCGC-AAA382N08 TaxID=1698285 RepID=A0A133VMW0_9EURY|nr:hypothetical protein AKJ56_02345 [candidate division MSBL1 archaeon SCGC-AAA382N08]